MARSPGTCGSATTVCRHAWGTRLPCPGSTLPRPVTELASATALYLAAVFAWAAVSKLRSPADTAAAFAGIGLAQPAALARLVPAAELIIAAALLLRPRPGAVGAIAALASFTAMLVGAMRRAGGTTVRCGCFGSASDTEVTRWMAEDKVSHQIVTITSKDDGRATGLKVKSPSPVIFSRLA